MSTLQRMVSLSALLLTLNGCAGNPEEPVTAYGTDEQPSDAIYSQAPQEGSEVRYPDYAAPTDVEPLYQPVESQGAYLLKAAFYAKDTGDKQQAIGFFNDAAALGDAQAHYELARIYTEGTLAPRDLTKANFHLKTSADLGNPEAIRVIAWKLIRGDDGKLDIQQGAALMEQAASKSVRAQRELGMLYANLYKPHLNDAAKGKAYLSLAYRSGDVDAAFQLGQVLVREGANLEAIEPLTYAAEHGQVRAGVELNRLAGATPSSAVLPQRSYSADEMYRKGNAIMLAPGHSPAAEADAYAWFDMAAEQGHAMAAEELRALEGVKIQMQQRNPDWLRETKARLSYR